MLGAAARVFHAHGYANASVKDIANELGILKGSLYHYIDTKEDLLFRVLESVHHDVEEILDEVAAAPALAPLERLHLYVARQVEFNARNIMRVALYDSDVERLTAERRAVIHAHRRRHEQFVTALIADAQADGTASTRHGARALANYVFGSIIWVYRWYRPDSALDAEGLAAIGADFAIRGVRGELPGDV